MVRRHGYIMFTSHYNPETYGLLDPQNLWFVIPPKPMVWGLYWNHFVRPVTSRPVTSRPVPSRPDLLFH